MDDEKADELAKQALNFNVLDLKVPYGDFYVWTGLSRRKEIVITQARIGHTYFTHSYLLKGEDMPWCIPCHCPDTIETYFTYFTHSYLLKGEDMPWCIPCHCPDTIET